jgi:hypothetical protein
MRIIFRATDKLFAVHARHRYFSSNKTEVVSRCFNSMINSIGSFRDQCEIIVVADKASASLLEAVKGCDVLLQRNYDGLKESILDSFVIANQDQAEWTFFIEDDYLFWSCAFERLFPALNKSFERGIGFKDYPGIVFHPSDYSDRYTRESDVRKKGHIMRCEDTYYRQIYNTTMTMLVNRYALNKATKEIIPLIKKRNQSQGFDEIFSGLYNRNDILCISPVPSFAFHLDNHNTQPPFVDWQKTWEESANV